MDPDSCKKSSVIPLFHYHKVEIVSQLYLSNGLGEGENVVLVALVCDIHLLTPPQLNQFNSLLPGRHVLARPGRVAGRASLDSQSLHLLDQQGYAGVLSHIVADDPV